MSTGILDQYSRTDMDSGGRGETTVPEMFGLTVADGNYSLKQLEDAEWGKYYKIFSAAALGNTL